MQQAMDEIRDYLAKIDEKVDDVLRAQKNPVLALVEVRDKAIETAAGAVDDARTLGTGAVDKAKTAAVQVDDQRSPLRATANESSIIVTAKASW